MVGAAQRRGPEHQFRILLLRFTSDGRLDTTLGGEGFVTTTVAETSDYLRAVAVQPDGKIVVAADSTRVPARGTTPNVFALVRYTSIGQPDATFGGGHRPAPSQGRRRAGPQLRRRREGRHPVEERQQRLVGGGSGGR